MISDYLGFAINNIRYRKVRSWLTVLGIVIGVAAIITLILVSQGLKNSIEEQFESFGPNRILISAKGFQGPSSMSQGLTTEDVDTIERLPYFEYVTPALAKTSEIEYRKQFAFATISAFPTEDFEDAFSDFDFSYSSGRGFRKGEKYVTIIGSSFAKDAFKKEMRVGNKIEINKKEFKIIGILEPIGNSQDDNSVNIPLKAAREVFDEPNKVDFIITKVKPGSNIPLIQEKIERALKRARDDENYQVMTAAQIIEQINRILGIVQFVLIGIAAISLIVGGIGIMNSMYTSVLERTREIGIMKSIGAKNSDVLMMFLVESGLIGLVGGVFGIIIGIALSSLVGLIATQAGFGLLKIVIDYKVVIFGLIFAFFVGIASGTFPARQAAKLKPVEALRYE